jgi:hypothetical protein
MLCSKMMVELTNTQTLDPHEWCNTDPAHRSPEECLKFYTTMSNGGFQRNGYDPVRRLCLRDQLRITD